MKALKLLLILVSAQSALAITVILPSDTAVEYRAVTGSEFLASSTAPNFLASSLNSFDSQATLEEGVAVPGSVFLSVSLAGNSFQSAVDDEQFFQFSLTPIEALAPRLSSLEFDARSGGLLGQRGWVVRSSQDGFSNDLGSGILDINQTLFQPYEISLESLQPISNVTTFRIYGYSEVGAGSGIFFDNIVLRATPIPEPTATLLMPLAMFLLGQRKRLGCGK